MKKMQAFIVLEAIIAGGPSTAALLYGLPVMLTFSLASIAGSPAVVGFGVFGLLGSTWALFEFWRLSLSTAGSARYEFGPRFWLAMLGAGLAVASLWPSTPAEALFLFAGLPALAAGHFSLVQGWRRQRG